MLRERIEEVITSIWQGTSKKEAVEQILAAIEEYCKENDIYRVEFGHYEEIWWVPLKTKRVNLKEVK